MSGLIGGGGNVSTTTPIISGLRVATASKGKCLPLAFGTARLAPNMLDYQDFTAIAKTETQGGKGGGPEYSSTTYTYTVGILLALCQTPIAAVTHAWVEKSRYYGVGELGFGFYIGVSSQDPCDYMQTKHPERALAYRHLAYLYHPAYPLGDTGYMQNHTFEVSTQTQYSQSIPDANPAVIINRLLLEPVSGAGFPAAAMADMTSYSNYCIASGLFLSPVYTDPSPCQQLLLTLADLTNTDVYYSEGLLKFKPRADAAVTGNGVTFTPVLTPLYDLTDDDFLSFIKVTRSSTADAFNRQTVKFFNRANDYNEETAEAKDQANIEIFGLRPAPEFDGSAIADAGVAQRVAQLLLQRGLYVRNQYEFSLGWRYALLEPTDIVTITDVALGLDRQPVRILSVEEDDWGELTLVAEELLIGVAQPAIYQPQVSQAYSHNYNVAAPDCATPVFMELESSGYRPDDDISLGIAVSGAGDNWGGADVWVSYDGLAYANVGRINGAARYGALVAPIASTAMDVVASVQIEASAQLVSASNTDAGKNTTISLIGDELVSYSDAALIAAGRYNLNLRNRGAFGSTPATHATGTRFVRLDDNVFWLNVLFNEVGTPLHIKLPSFNPHGGGLQGLDEVDPYVIQVMGKPPAVVTGLIATARTEDLLLTWTAPPDRDIAGYEVRYGSSWASSTLISMTDTSSLAVSATFIGVRLFWVRAFDTAGNYSPDASVSFTMVPPPAPAVRAEVIDNNVLLYWSKLAGTLPVSTFAVRRGVDFATSASIGNKDGGFTSIFEALGGINTYWVNAVDRAGNAGAATSVVVSVSEPPDYVLSTASTSTFSGTKVSAAITDGGLLLPIDPAETWQTHFTSRGWATVQDQINAGFPRYAQPGQAAGSYSEVIDFGAVLPRHRLGVYADVETIAAPVDVDIQIETSLDGVTWADPVAVAVGFFQDFRYIRYTLTVTAGSSGTGLALVKSLEVRLDAKKHNLPGRVTCAATDVTGTRAYLTADGTATGSPVFSDVLAIVPGVPSVTSASAVFDFLDAPNPTFVDWYLFDNNGNRISGELHYTVTGI